MTTAQEEITALALRGHTGSVPIRETNEYRAEVRKRTRELVSQTGMSWEFAQARALQEMREERRATSEQELKRAAHDAMTRGNDPAAARDRWVAQADETTGADRTTALLMAQLNHQAARDRA